MREVPLGGDVLREQQDAAGVLIEAMDHPHARVGRAAGRDAELPAEPLEHAVRLATSGDRGQAGGLGDGNPISGFPEDFQIV